MTDEELQQRETALEQREQTLRVRIVRAELSAQLAEAGCRPEALADAAALMSASATTIDLAEDGLSIEKVSLGGEPMGVAAAVRAFVKSRSYFLAPADDGKGTKAPPAPQSAVALLGRELSQAPAPAPKPATKAAPALDSSASAHDLMAAGLAKPIE